MRVSGIAVEHEEPMGVRVVSLRSEEPHPHPRVEAEYEPANDKLDDAAFGGGVFLWAENWLDGERRLGKGVDGSARLDEAEVDSLRQAIELMFGIVEARDFLGGVKVTHLFFLRGLVRFVE
jgi:hypothetical protein